MLISVRLFAGLRDRAGSSELMVELAEAATVADLLRALKDTPLGDLPPRSFIVAVDREYATPDRTIGRHEEVALIPPVSGGADPVRLVSISRDPIDLAALGAAVRDPRAGAVVTFEGVTREVDYLDYEAYAEMAEPKLRAIATEEADRHALCAVAVAHRVGRVPLSEPSVVVAASAPHRGEAFAGARAVIDRLKEEAPIWKREEGEWVEGKLPGS